MRMKVKVCMVGGTNTGKTELVRRFVLDVFNDAYVQTIGTRLSKKFLKVSSPGEGEVLVEMGVWDILGNKRFRELLKEAYFYGADGILAVCNVAHRETLQELDDWIEGVYSVVGRVPSVLAINRVDPSSKADITESDAKRFSDGHGAPYYFTSTIEGENVETMFRSLAGLIVENRL